LRIPSVSGAGLTSILDFRAETAAEAKKLALEKIYDNACCKKFRKKLQSKENS
jgi:hypothetical protein